MLFAGFTVAEYRTAPHMQPPCMSGLKVAPPSLAGSYRCCSLPPSILAPPFYRSYQLTVEAASASFPSWAAALKKSPADGGALAARKRGSCSAALVATPSRVPGATFTLCHERGFSPTLKKDLLRGWDRYQTGHPGARSDAPASLSHNRSTS